MRWCALYLPSLHTLPYIGLGFGELFAGIVAIANCTYMNGSSSKRLSVPAAVD